MMLTIFTPIYNRENLIDKLYNSLSNQSCQEFEWLVVDDGSTDNVRQRIEGYKGSARFRIRYIYQENQGKHVAYNTAIKNCETELFMCVDSDDSLTKDAVEKIYCMHEKWNDKEILGYFFRKRDTHNKISGDNFSFEKSLVGLREIYFKYHFEGELCIVLRTVYAKKALSPVFENEKFVTESVVYNQLTSIAPMVWNNDVIYIYEYQPDGYTLNSKKQYINNPYGVAMGYLSDSAYGEYLLDKIKKYSAYLGMRKVFMLNDNDYYNELLGKIGWPVKWIGWILNFHYVNLFNNLIKSI